MPAKTLDSAALDRAAGTEATNIEVQRKEALLKAGALQNAIFNSANFSSIATDAKGVIQIFNVGAERMLGYAAADVMNKITPADISDPQEVIARAKALSAELGTPITPGFEALVFKASRGIEDIYELTYIRKDGSRFPAVVSVTALRDAQDAIIGYLLIGTDNTARKQIEEQLRWTEESFRLMVESVTDYAIVMLDPEGRVVSWNSGAQRIKGYSAEEIVGQHFSRFYPHQEVDRGAPQRDLDLVTAKGRFEYEGWRVRKDGSTFWANVVITAIRDQVGNLRGFAKLTRDLTERRKVDAELTNAKAAAEGASLAKSDFLANMSHELRTPLNSIIGFSEMLKDGLLGELDAKQRESIADIFDAGTHLLSLINDILDLSKVEAGMLQLEADAVDVEALLKASTLVVRERALAHRIRLDTDLDPALGTMLADQRKLKQIVYNLLSNAVKFTAEGGAVTLRARRCMRAEVALDAALPGRLIALPPGEDGEFLAVTVEDTGVGIAEEHLPKLFEPFMQVDSSAARRQAGTGLGLSLVRRLAELHGGTVGVASRPGVGSQFCVWLPYRAAA